MQHSENIEQLVLALLEAGAHFAPLKATKTNPYFNSKYAGLDDVIESTVSALTDLGIAVIQTPTTMTDGAGQVLVGCTTMLVHTSGQWVKGTVYLPLAKNDPQAAGSAITYARRYSLAAMLNIVAEPDDDANAATPPPANAAPVSFEL